MQEDDASTMHTGGFDAFDACAHACIVIATCAACHRKVVKVRINGVQMYNLMVILLIYRAFICSIFQVIGKAKQN